MSIMFTTISEVPHALEVEAPEGKAPIEGQARVVAQQTLSQTPQTSVTSQRQYEILECSIPECSVEGRIGLAMIGLVAFGIAAFSAGKGNQTLTIGASIVAGVAFITLCGVMTVPACHPESESLATNSNQAHAATRQSR